MNHYQGTALNETLDISKEFRKQESTYFFSSKMEQFDVSENSGRLKYERHMYKNRTSFNQTEAAFEPTGSWEFPAEYEEHPALPFQISFVSPYSVRLRLRAKPGAFREEESIMLQDAVPTDTSWVRNDGEGVTEWSNEGGSITLVHDPFQLIFKDANGRVLTQTYRFGDSPSLLSARTIPFSFVRSAATMQMAMAATFKLSPQEKLFGCGESFTSLNKRGQKIDLWTRDALSVQTANMYKPIPFFLSSRGYGMFVHTSVPTTFDFGATNDEMNTIYLGDEEMDLFFFFGEPKQIISEYTALTGRSTLPPLWSFGLWMSRITYKSEEETREVARTIRELRIPCDVIHLDTGWFEKDWRCNYLFSSSRFDDPQKMITELKEQGFRISLWQLPYFTPSNELYQEIIELGLAVRDVDGRMPTEDAILDFSNPQTVEWYQNKIAHLLNLGVSAIKADFGEAGPLHGYYHSGKSGYYEHNLYPLRYNKAVADITQQVNDESIIWARSAWAGSQRYPIHWGGDAENTNNAMATSLRGGLSLGLSGFTFWSHDIGGFVRQSPENLYRRWMPFGMLTSHSRCHGAPPKEPWAYGESFVNDFRMAVELKYRLLPYIYTQAQISCQAGHPLMRTLFFEFPDDPAAWLIDDQYMLGLQLLVAPLFEDENARNVYLPPGVWIDYQTRNTYDGGRWHRIEAASIPIVLLVKAGSLIAHAKECQSTGEMDWDDLELISFAATNERCQGLLYHPSKREMISLKA